MQRRIAWVGGCKNVQKIGKNAFSGAKNLKKLTLNGNVTTKFGKNAFKGISKNAKITVTAKNKKQYETVVKAMKKVGAKKATFQFRKGK